MRPKIWGIFFVINGYNCVSTIHFLCKIIAQCYNAVLEKGGLKGINCGAQNAALFVDLL